MYEKNLLVVAQNGASVYLNMELVASSSAWLAKLLT